MKVSHLCEIYTYDGIDLGLIFLTYEAIQGWEYSHAVTEPKKGEEPTRTGEGWTAQQLRGFAEARDAEWDRQVAQNVSFQLSAAAQYMACSRTCSALPIRYKIVFPTNSGIRQTADGETGHT